MSTKMERGRNKRDAAKEDKRDNKLEEQILKSLNHNASVEERFQALLQKHVESERENRRLKQEVKSHEKQFELISREKDNLQKELNRSVLVREKLTEVAREQQKMIKALKNESMQQLKEEEDKRKESQHKFQASLEEISQCLNKNNEENIKLRDYNIEMTKKLKFLAEQYQTREQQLEKLNEQISLENQIHAAKLSKVQVQAAMEKEILTKERQIALEKLLQAQKTLKEMTEREQALKGQLDLYTAKYDDFQSSLQKSNDIFATYKAELDKMSKNTRKLEKEAVEWKRRWEKSNATLIELVTEKKDRDEHAMRCNKQVEQLKKLLRALQNERSHLYKCIRENNIECPPVPQLPPEPETEKDKLDIMSKNCADLKKTVSWLEGRMQILDAAEVANSENEEIVENGEGSNKKNRQRPNKRKNNQEIKEKKEAVKTLSKQISEETESTVNSINDSQLTLPESNEKTKTPLKKDDPLKSPDTSISEEISKVEGNGQNINEVAKDNSSSNEPEPGSQEKQIETEKSAIKLEAEFVPSPPESKENTVPIETTEIVAK